MDTDDQATARQVRYSWVVAAVYTGAAATGCWRLFVEGEDAAVHSWMLFALLPLAAMHWVVFVRREVSQRLKSVAGYGVAVIVIAGLYRTEYWSLATAATLVLVVWVAWFIWRYFPAERA